MPTSDCINVHIVGAHGIDHQTDFREFCLKGQRQGQLNTIQNTSILIIARGWE